MHTYLRAKERYVGDKNTNGQLIITCILVHLVSRWSSLILTVLTNQFIRTVNVTQDCAVGKGTLIFIFFFHIIFSHFIIGGKYCLYLETQQLVSYEKAIHRLTCQMYYQFISLDWEPKGILIVLTLIRQEKKMPSFSSWTCDLNTDLVYCSVKCAPAAPAASLRSRLRTEYFIK